MVNNKISLGISLLLVLFLSVSSVNASDMNFTDFDSIISNSNDTINLTGDVIKDESEFDTYQNGIVIDKNLTINGNNYKIDANNNGRIFHITQDSIVKLINVTLINGDTTRPGGAIYSAGELILENCSFINNSATNGGGAIYSISDLTVENSYFDNNYCQREGGAIFTSGTITVNNSLFKSNQAFNFPNGMGGAIASDSAYIENSTFFNNTANMRGGSVISNFAHVKGSKFISSESSYGAAISTDEAIIISSSFDLNHAINNGAIFGSDVEVYESNFTNNFASYGGAVCVDNITVNNSLFSNNFGFYGGALNFDFGTVSNSTFENNVATLNGGAIDLYTYGYITDCTFINNSALQDNYGGAIYNNGLLNLSDNIFINNSALYGSSIYNNARIFLNNNSISHNSTIPIYNNGHIQSEINIIILNNNTLTCALGDEIILNATITDDNGNLITGRHIIFTINNSTMLSNENFTANYTFDTFGKYLISASYVGSNNYNLQTAIVDVKLVSVLTGDNLEMYFSNGVYYVNLTDIEGNPIANETVIITINGVSYSRVTNENGTASIRINLNSGNYSVNAIFNGNDMYLASNPLNNTINVLPTINSQDIIKIFRNESQFVATFFDSNGNLLINQTVQFNVNGVIYNRTTNDRGIAVLNINLNPGNYIITAYNPATNEKQSANITVLPIIVDNDDLVKYFRNESQYTVKVLDNQGNPIANRVVTFNINGVLYNRTSNEEGIATLNINLNPGNYIITAGFNGYYVSNDITVLSVLYSQDLEMNYSDGSTFDVTLVDGQGNKLANETVTFNINGIIYERITDNDGVAKLNINLMAGKYIITSSYNGLNVANTITVF